MGCFGVILLLAAVLQAVVLLLSPFYKAKSPFSWYYTRIFKPLLQDDQRYQWKFYLVPCFYMSLYGYIVYVLIQQVLPAVQGRLWLIEKVAVIPILLLITPVLGFLSMIVTPETTRSHLPGFPDQYEPDGIIYYPGITCRTCHLRKPARSKHCNICQACVLVADHHCIWVNNCIGKGNYVYFFSFLLANVASLSYGFLRVLQISVTGSERYTRSTVIFMILCGTFAVICGVFTALQLQLVSDGMTTNERDKWYTIQQIMREGSLVRTPQGEWFIRAAHNPAEFFSTNAYDDKAYALKNYKLIRDPSQIPNIYDYGSLWQNLKRLCT
ncbi:hypothetical protein HG536_0C01680 [Torulaspora globosa]|uniref:Palmitoyltransferase n=1 Tax=Torulaspora globosa TaxID=48254 RepID=A0A7G3ZER4_9SACH|nr:uncharacterized protein HG536_0C01680 [Torulaspora globosa]QLL32000.1 hypothetical protein HG536_0C01680 [Torulaspora globosa]